MKKAEKNCNSSHQLCMNEAFPSKEMLFKKTSQNNQAPSKRFANLMFSDNELEKMTEVMVNKSNSKNSVTKTQEIPNRQGSALSSLSSIENANKHMIFRRKSQGLERSTAKKNYQSKLGNGKVVADYLPQLKCAKQIDEDNVKLSGKEDNHLLEPRDRVTKVFNSLIDETTPTDKFIQISKFDFSCVDDKKSNDEPDSPAQDEKEDDVDDDDTSDDQDDSDDSEEDLIEQERREKEIQEIQEWAKINGFQVAIEQPKDSTQTQLLEKRLNKKKDKLVELTDQKFKSASKNYQEHQNKGKNPNKDNLTNTNDWMDNWQSLSIEKQMKDFIPPPCDILQKQFGDNEPIRTGFNQGLIPISIRDNCERGHYPQGPQIVVTTQNVYNTLKRRETLNEKREKLKKRNTSKDIPAILRNSALKETSEDPLAAGAKAAQASKTIEIIDNKAKQDGKGLEEGNKDVVLSENENDKVQQVIHQAMMNSETSLRHLFYLEYKKTFTDGQQNPIVFSKFGKQYYGSDEKFDPNNFQQLIRTCNLKRLIRANNQLAQLKGGRKFSEPVSYPSGSYYRPVDANDRTLVFESRFESGNLQLVHKKSEAEYDLVLQNDINSKGHTQWFYFRVTNVKKGQKVKFNMLNMIKSKSLYNEGMKVLFYSEKRQENQRKKLDEKGWGRGGEELSYFQNNYRKENQPQILQQRCYFTFTFTYTFEFDEDMVYFAYSQPYTYSNLVNDLNEIQAKKHNYVSRHTLCRTIAGNKCEYLTISNRVPVEQDRKKQGVIITARIHPGESNSSWMMKGVIDYLISDDLKAIELRNKFIFKVVPMLNPDGVINGNYRCSLAGCDLNRRWKYPSEMLHPTIYHTKKLISRLAKDRTLALYCDLHGHSRRKNVFFYGNTINNNPEASRVFPFLMSKIAQPNYSYDYSKFNVCRTKEHTARIAMFRDLGSKNPNIYTLEASFCGPKSVRHEPHRRRQPYFHEVNYHFNTQDYTRIGHNLCETLLLYKAEEESTVGLQNIEYQIQQFQIQKQNMLELDEIIKQQKEETEKKTLYGTVGKSRTSSELVTMQPTKEKTSTNNARESRENSVQKQYKKATRVKNNEKTVNLLIEFNKNGKLQRPMEKKKVKYNFKGANDSECESDSEPSDDNLDQDEIMKLIPKKFGKAKYLKGLLEKKKIVVVEEKKEIKKKPKATLMPCMISSKKEREKLQKTNEQPLKKQYVSKSVVAVLRKGGKFRDVGTQITYNGDGRNLLLMEQDILATTGCRWSKIIYSGYKGVRPLQKESFISADRLIQECHIRNSSDHRLTQSTPSNQNYLISTHNEFKQVVKSNGLRNQIHTEINQIDSQSLLKNVISANKQDKRIHTPRQQNVSPFMNEIIKQAAQTEQKNDEVLLSLQKRIQDANFNEPRSLIGGMSMTSNDYQLFPNDKQNNSSKKRNGLPIYEYQKKSLIQKFDFKHLETVQEKVKHPATNHYDRESLDKKNRQQSILNSSNSVTKKIVNGEIVRQMQHQQQLLPKVGEKQQLSGHKPRNRSLNSQGGGLSLSGHKNRDLRTSFKYVAHHMLNESQSQNNYENKFMKTDIDLRKADMTPSHAIKQVIGGYEIPAFNQDKNTSEAHVPQISKMNVKLLRQAFFNNDQLKQCNVLGLNPN